MCHLIEMSGGVADGATFEYHGDLPLTILAWHDAHEPVDGYIGCGPQCRGTVMVDAADPVEIPPSEVDVSVYVRRYRFVLSLVLPPGTVVAVPYDLVSEQIEHATTG